MSELSDLSSDSTSICSTGSSPFIEEPCFGISIFGDSDDSDIEDIFPLSYNEEWSSDDNSCESFNMSAKIILSDDDVETKKEKTPKRKLFDTSQGQDKESSIFVPDGDYGDEIIFVEPENYSPKKKMKLDEEKRTAEIDTSSVGTDTEIAVTFSKKGIDFPHAREHCRVKKFVLNPSITAKNPGNEEFCSKCYCYVCDDLSSKCESWKTGEHPHCNAYAKHAFWENKRRLHKRDKNNSRADKKFIYVPILSLINTKNISQEMTKAAISCNKYADEMQEIVNSSYDNSTARKKRCSCFCHMDDFRDYTGCHRCEWEHLRQQNYTCTYNGLNERAMDKIRMVVSRSVNSAESYLKRKQPNPAIVILDSITSLLLGADIISAYPKYISERDSSRMIHLWIQAALDKGTDKDLLSKAKGHLSESVKNSQNPLFLSEAKKMHKILSELRPYEDPLVVKCLTKMHKGGSGLKEPQTVAKMRLEYLKSNNKFSEALNYMLGVEVDDFNGASTHRLCDFSEHRNELVDLLVTNERMQEALTVCTTHLSDKLPTDLGKIGKNSTRNSSNMHWTPIKSMSLKTFKKLFSGLVKQKSNSISEDGLKKAMMFTLPGMYCNVTLTTQGVLEFLLTEISAQHKDYKYTSEAVRKDVQQSASTFLDTKVKKGLHHFSPEDIKAPRNVPLQVYVIEILLLVFSSRMSVLKCLQSLVKKKLFWACESLVFSPQLQGTLQPQEVSYFTKNILPNCSHLPLDCFKNWLNNIHAITHFQLLFNLVCDMFYTGCKKKGTEGVGLKRNAMLLSQTLMESVLLHSYGKDRSLVEKHIKTVQEKFPTEAFKSLGISATTWGPLELDFIFKPDFKTLEAIRNSVDSQNKVEFIKKREILLQFLKKNSRFFQEAAIEIFMKLEMYKDLLGFLYGISGAYSGFESNISKINARLEEMKQMGDETKAMALAEALKDYVASALVHCSYSCNAFRQITKPVPKQVSDCLKLIHSISQALFVLVIQKAVDIVTQKYLNNTVSQQKRIELGNWLLEIKGIFTSVKENEKWPVFLTGILQGPLRRKNQIVTSLRWTTGLL